MFELLIQCGCKSLQKKGLRLSSQLLVTQAIWELRWGGDTPSFLLLVPLTPLQPDTHLLFRFHSWSPRCSNGDNHIVTMRHRERTLRSSDECPRYTVESPGTLESFQVWATSYTAVHTGWGGLSTSLQLPGVSQLGSPAVVWFSHWTDGTLPAGLGAGKTSGS